jgi:phosphatidylserine/phosphatidylglycerophosphate/cardiolipin synthase-like enzyme
MSSINIITEGSLTTFADVAFANKYRLRRMWLVSPWMTIGESKVDPLSLIIEAVKYRSCVVQVLTRSPREGWHRQAIEILRATVNPILLYSPHLHAKLYILDCDGFRYALLGSPNLTRRALVQNRELAVEFRTSYSSRVDNTAAMVEELISYANSLMADDDAELE